MNANLRNFALWIIIVLLLLALFTLFQNPGHHVAAQDISFSQLLTEVEQNHVRDVVIQGQEIHGTLHQRLQLPDLCAERSRARAKALRCEGADHREAARRQRAVVRLAARLVVAVRCADRRVDFSVASDAGRRRQGNGLRQVARQDADRGARTRQRSRMSRVSTRPSRICRKLSSSCVTPENTNVSADGFPAAYCWSARPAPARR